MYCLRPHFRVLNVIRAQSCLWHVNAIVRFLVWVLLGAGKHLGLIYRWRLLLLEGMISIPLLRVVNQIFTPESFLGNARRDNGRSDSWRVKQLGEIKLIACSLGKSQRNLQVNCSWWSHTCWRGFGYAELRLLEQTINIHELLEGVKALKKLGFALVVLTARQVRERDRSMNWLERHYPGRPWNYAPSNEY